MDEKLKYLLEKLPEWLNNSSKEDIIISSRVRFARNIKGVLFPSVASQEELLRVDYRIEDVLRSIDIIEEIRIYPAWELDEIGSKILIERHLASRDLFKRKESAGLAFDKSERISIMINEEDHIRIQCIYENFKIEEAFIRLIEIDDEIGSLLTYSYKDTLGFITSCPTNLGTGFRASVLLHIPALFISGKIEEILKELISSGIIIRGYYGEGSEIIGNIIQCSTSQSLGKSEEEIIEDFKEKIYKIVEKEKKERKELIEKKYNLLEDKVYRAYGILKNARSLSAFEMIELLSSLRLGASLGIFKNIDFPILNELMIFGQPAHLQYKMGRILSQEERDYLRSLFIRKKVSEIGI